MSDTRRVEQREMEVCVTQETVHAQHQLEIENIGKSDRELCVELQQLEEEEEDDVQAVETSTTLVDKVDTSGEKCGDATRSCMYYQTQQAR